MTSIAVEFPQTTWRIKRELWRLMVESGALEGQRVQLIFGEIVQMSPQNVPHAACIRKLSKILMIGVGDRAEVGVQLPMSGPRDSEPEPDIYIVEVHEQPDDHPDSALLVVEVADSSLRFDRSVKKRLYAAMSVPSYWIVNLADQCVEVFETPVKGAYTASRVAHLGETLVVPQFPDVIVELDKIFLPNR